VFPPHCEASAPALALPILAAALRAAGHDVSLRDVNAESWAAFLTPERLTQARNAVEGRLEALPRARSRSFADQVEYDALARALAGAADVIAGVDRARLTLRSAGYYDHGRHQWARRTLDGAFRLLGAEHGVQRWDSVELLSRRSVRSSAQVLAACADERENPYYAYFSRVVVPALLRERPGLVGISVAYRSQLVPALTLAALVRAQARGAAHVCVGGSYITLVHDAIRLNPPLAAMADSFVVGDGEDAVVELAGRLGRGGRERGGERGGAGGGVDLGGIANLAFCPRPGAVPRVNEPFRAHVPAGDPTPEFGDLPWHLYLQPEPVVPLHASLGCAWGRCAFCAISHSGRADRRHRERPVGDVVRDMSRIQREVGCRRFQFVDHAIAPARLRDLARAIIAAGLDVEWMCWTRFDPAMDPQTADLMYRAGCRLVSLGLESASTRVLVAMNKGIDLRAAGRELQGLAGAGMAVVPTFFVGFPGSRASDERMTLRFLWRHRAAVTTASAAHFSLERHSLVHADPGRYGVRRVWAPPGEDLALDFAYDVEHGLQPAVARRIARQCAQWVERVFGDPLAGEFAWACRAAPRPARLRPRWRPRAGLGRALWAAAHLLRRPRLAPEVGLVRFDEDVIAVARVAEGLWREAVENQSRHGVPARESWRAALRGRPPVPAGSALMLYSPATGERMVVGAGTARLLARCDGGRSAVAAVRGAVPGRAKGVAPSRALRQWLAAVKVLDDLAGRGFLVGW